MKIIAAFWIVAFWGALAQDLDEDQDEIPPLAFPYEFDFSDMSNCTITEQRFNQSSDCHSSWLSAALVSISLRRCYQFENNEEPLSIPYVKSCMPAGSCNGGLTKLAWEYLSTTKVPDAACIPYDTELSSCPSTCTNSSETFQQYGISTYRKYRGVPSIQMAIMQGGPVQACFKVYQDFNNYQGGVYVQNYGAYLQYACFVLTGWQGNAWNGLNFWYNDNSYSTFYIQMGECGVENDVWGGVPIQAPIS